MRLNFRLCLRNTGLIMPKSSTQPPLYLLVLLYRLREYIASASRQQQDTGSPQQQLLKKYQHLINNFYLEKRTVEEYAELMHLSAPYLSNVIKEASGNNALSFINDRILKEAKILVQFTQADMAEIAWQLNFSDPANFGKFFKKHTGFSPLQFRKHSTSTEAQG